MKHARRLDLGVCLRFGSMEVNGRSRKSKRKGKDMEKLKVIAVLMVAVLLPGAAIASVSGHTVQTGTYVPPIGSQDVTLCWQDGWDGGWQTPGDPNSAMAFGDRDEAISNSSTLDPIIGTSSEPHTGFACWRYSGGFGYPGGIGDPKTKLFTGGILGVPANPTAQADKVEVTYWFKPVSATADGTKIEVSIGKDDRYERMFFDPWITFDPAEAGSGLTVKMSEQTSGTVYESDLDPNVWHKITTTWQSVNGTGGDIGTIQVDDGTVHTFNLYNYWGMTAKGGSLDFRTRHEIHTGTPHPECRGFYFDDISIRCFDTSDPGTTLFYQAVGFERKGDADYDGDADNVDFGRLLGAFTGPGGTGQTWEQGNFDDDGDVDNVDFGALLGGFTGPLAGNATDSGDRADLIYDAATGNVKIDPSEATGGVITNWAFENASAAFNAPGVCVFPTVGYAMNTDTAGQISQTDVTMAGFSYLADLGNIFPTGLTVEGLQSLLTTASYVGTVGSGQVDFDLIVIPEPATLALLGLGGVGMLIRRKRS